jgi:hypothetical protein
MSEREHNIRGIHHEISKPRKSPYDGYYYQRVRQVDDRGSLVGTGEQTHKSASPDSSDGLVAEPGSVQPPLMAPGATRGAGYIGAAVAPPIPFIPAVPDSAPGGIPGLMIEAGQTDPLNPNAPPPGGLAGLIQEYLRNNHRDSN